MTKNEVPLIDKTYDIVVCGGGVGGVITAVTAARKGLRTALVDNKAGLGGNACSEIGVSIEGSHFFGYFINMREGGPVEEMKERLAEVDPYFTNGQNSTVFLFWCQEAGVDVYSELNLFAVEKEGIRLTHVRGTQGGTERHYRFAAKQFVDATGDGTVAHLAGCQSMTGREAKETFGEVLAPDKADTGIMGASLLYRASEKKEATPFVRPPWAYEYKTNDDLPHRLTMYKGPVECGFWWIEYAGDHDDPIGEYETIRQELLKCLYGVWAHLKADPERGMEKWSLDRVSISPAKRESRRLVGDVVITEKDVVNRTPFPDAVAYAGWNIDIHVPGGFKSRLRPNIHAYFPWVAPVPLRSLYAKDLDNLWLVGRDMSVSHVALGATRLQATIGSMGHAVACAAAEASRRGSTTRVTAKEHIGSIQQEILKDGSHIPGVANRDPGDLARTAKASATSDLALAFPPSDNWLPVGRGRALSFPHPGGRLESLTLPLKNESNTATAVKLFFAPCLHPNHFTHEKALVEKTVSIEPGTHPVAFELNLDKLPRGLYGVLVMTEGNLSWQQSAEAPYGAYTGLYEPDRYFVPKADTKENLYDIAKPIMLTPPGESAAWVRVKKARLLQKGRNVDRKRVPLPVVAAQPEIRPYGAHEVLSGVNHTDLMPELWVSDPAQALPQSLTLTWDKPQAIREVRLIFDTDLDLTHPAVEPIELTARDYTLSAQGPSGWTELLKVSGNTNRHRVHPVAASNVTALKIEVTAVNAGGKSARLFEVRVY